MSSRTNRWTRGLSPTAKTPSEELIIIIQRPETAIRYTNCWKKFNYVEYEKEIKRMKLHVKSYLSQPNRHSERRYNEAKGAILTRLSDLTEGGTYFKAK